MMSRPLTHSFTNARRLITGSRRWLSSKKSMTDAEREEALHQANEKMKAYYTNRPPIEVIQESKRRSQKRDQEHYIQALIGMFLLLSLSLSYLCILITRIHHDALEFRINTHSYLHHDSTIYVQYTYTYNTVGSFLAGFVLTPFLGKKIAKDPEFRARISLPSWYDFSLAKPESAWTRAELHEQIVQVQKDLHERAIQGEFTPEKLQAMRRKFQATGDDAEADARGWSNLHPGLDDDEDIED